MLWWYEFAWKPNEHYSELLNKCYQAGKYNILKLNSLFLGKERCYVYGLQQKKISFFSILIEDC